MDIVPRADHLDGRWSAVLSLRREMQKIGTPNDTSPADSTIDPGRTVDAPTLALLKSPYYPFTLCEEAPASYIPPPVPFDVNEEISRLRDLLCAVQSELDVYRMQLNGANAGDTADGLLTPSAVVTFLNDSIPYMDLAWGISSLQWFHLWVLSHSISGLRTAIEQLEYVLTDHGQALPESAEVIEENIRQCPFPMAVDRVEKDRKAVIQLERERLNSKSRTYRDRVSSSVITAVTSPFLSAEEKYMYQELFNETEYRMQTHHLAKMKNRVSRGSSVVNSSTMSGVNSSLVRSSLTVFYPEIHTTVEDALLTLDREEEMITKLIRTIQERKAANIRFDKSEVEKEASRRAQITVYGCLLSDEQLMSIQQNAVRTFLMDYQGWVGHLNFGSHDDLMAKLSEFSGEHGRWPAPEPTSYYTVYQERFQAQNNYGTTWQRGGDVKNAELGSFAGEFLRREHGVNNSSGISSVATDDGDLHHTGTGMRVLDSGVSSAPSSSSNSGVSESLFALLQGVFQKRNRENPSFYPSSLNRLWMIFAVRLATQNFVHLKWDPSTFLHESDTCENTLRRMVNSSSSVLLSNGSEVISVLFKIIQCLCNVLLRKPYSSFMYEVAYINVPPLYTKDSLTSSASDSFLTSFEVSQWAALLDALWFQIDPSNQANGGFLEDTNLQSLPSVRFFKLSAATFSKPMLQLFYGVDENQGGTTVYTVREIAEKPLTFLRTAEDRYRFAFQLFSAFQKLENAGILSFYACRVHEVPFVQLVDVVFVYCHSEGGRDCWDSFGLLPPAAVELKRMEVGRNTSLPTSPNSYSSPINFSSVLLQVGDVLTFLSTVPKPVLSLMYYYGEMLREQGFWEVENNVVPHAFIASYSYPMNMNDETLNLPLSSPKQSPQAGVTSPGALVASSHRQLAGAVMRQLKEIMKSEENPEKYEATSPQS